MIKLFFDNCTADTEHDAARSLAEAAFRELFGRDGVLTHDKRGKPYFAGEDSVFVSISHSEGRCLAAVSDSPVGADIEYMKGGAERLTRLADRYFTKAEAEYVRSDPEVRFYEIWCKKESFVKYTGEGFSRRLDSFSVLEAGEVSYSFMTEDGYAIAVCSGKDAPLELRHNK